MARWIFIINSGFQPRYSYGDELNFIDEGEQLASEQHYEDGNKRREPFKVGKVVSLQIG
ncbi:MAG: hypothetical protein WBG46_06785 [Nonlabens sp.]